MGMQEVRRLCTSLGQCLLPWLCSFQEGLLNEGKQGRILLISMFVALEVWKHAETVTEQIVQWQPLRCSICCYWHNYQIFLYIPVSTSCPCTPSLDSFTSQKSIIAFHESRKGGAFHGVQVQRELLGIWRKGNYTCMQYPYFLTHWIAS